MRHPFLIALCRVSGALQGICDIRMTQKAASQRNNPFILRREGDVLHCAQRAAVNVSDMTLNWYSDSVLVARCENYI